MHKVISTLLVYCSLIQAVGQTPKKVMIFFEPQFSQTLKDRTKENNLWGLGFGLEAIFKTKTKFSALLNLSDDFIFLDDKVYRTNIDGSESKSIQNVFNFFIGTSFNPYGNLYISVVGGPSFINGQTLLGIKPSIGLYFPKTKRWTGKVSYTNIFNRDSGEKENYSSLIFSLGVRLF